MTSNSAPLAPPPSNQSAVAMIARQAIVNAQQAVVGYELFNRSRTGIAHTAATDVILVFTALSHAGTEELVGKKLIFVNCTHESLAGGHLELVDPDKVVLEIPPLGHTAADEVALRMPILAELRERGFHLAFNHTVLQSAYAPWLPLADYIKLDLSILAPDQLAVLISYAGRHSKAELIAEKVETAQQYDMVSSQGVQMFQGYWFARPALVEAKLLTPSQASIIELINQVRYRQDMDIELYVVREFRLPKEKEIHIFRMIQEIVLNTIKHADAHNLQIGFSEEEGYLLCLTKDDGKGFDREKVLAGSTGLGLRSLQSRCEILDGILTLDSMPGAGTNYFIRIPMG